MSNKCARVKDIAIRKHKILRKYTHLSKELLGLRLCLPCYGGLTPNFMSGKSIAIINVTPMLRKMGEIFED